MNSAIDQEFFQYFTQLDDEQKTSMLQLLKTFLKGSKTPESINIDEYNREIDNALAEAAAGNYISQEEMEKRAAEW